MIIREQFKKEFSLLKLLTMAVGFWPALFLTGISCRWCQRLVLAGPSAWLSKSGNGPCTSRFCRTRWSPSRSLWECMAASAQTSSHSDILAPGTRQPLLVTISRMGGQSLKDCIRSLTEIRLCASFRLSGWRRHRLSVWHRNFAIMIILTLLRD